MVVPDLFTEASAFEEIPAPNWISVLLSSRKRVTNLLGVLDNFNIYGLNKYNGEYVLLRDGSEDQPDLSYKYPSVEIKELFKQD